MKSMAYIALVKRGPEIFIVFFFFFSFFFFFFVCFLFSPPKRMLEYFYLK